LEPIDFFLVRGHPDPRIAVKRNIVRSRDTGQRRLR